VRDDLLNGVPDRLALGATAFARVPLDFSLPEVQLEVLAADETILAIDWVEHPLVALRGVGIGETTITARIRQTDPIVEYPIEVAAPTRFEVLLVSGNYPTSEGALDGKALLAEVPQQVLVTYHDPDGWLSGSGLADFVMPSANGSECEVSFGLTLEARCWRPVPGPQVIRVTVSETERWVSMTAVAPDDIVDLVLARTEEEDAEPGETLRIDVLGLTDDGTEVYGMHASAADGWLPFPIAYAYDPDAEPQSLTVNAIGLERELVYRGRLTWPDWRGESD
jgi:hypothetical protein